MPSYSTGESGAYFDLAEMDTQANPPAGVRRLYAKATGMVALDSLGSETALGGAGTAAWGTISGVLSAQTDLQASLDAKCANNDARLSDAREPLAHAHDYAAISHNHAGTYEPANANIQAHVAQAHAPSNAQKNSDITKAEIEAKLTGEISSHTHAGGGSGAGLTRISGNSGAAGADFTFQRLSANAAANLTTVPLVVMTTTGVGAGTWAFKYLVRYQSGATTTGIGLCVNHTGTTGTFLSNWTFVSTGGAAATGVADQVASVSAGQLVEGKSERVKNTVSSASAGVDTINADCLAIVEGLIVVTVSGSLELKHSSEIAASTQVMADTLLDLRKIA